MGERSNQAIRTRWSDFQSLGTAKRPLQSESPCVRGLGVVVSVTTDRSGHPGKGDTQGPGTIWGRPTLTSLKHTDAHKPTGRCQVCRHSPGREAVCQPTTVSSFQRKNLLPKTGRHSPAAPRRQPCCTRQGQVPCTREHNPLALWALPGQAPVRSEAPSQGPSKQPDQPASPSGPGGASGNSVVLRYCLGVGGVLHLCVRSELLQTLPALSSYLTHRIPPM